LSIIVRSESGKSSSSEIRRERHRVIEIELSRSRVNGLGGNHPGKPRIKVLGLGPWGLKKWRKIGMGKGRLKKWGEKEYCG